MGTGKYVVIDGMDGSGKGTQIKLLQEKFPRAVFTREPGGTPFAEKIRKLVVDDPLAKQSTPLNNFFLFFAAREDLLHNLVLPALEADKLVFSDRADSSTYGYQGEAEQNPLLIEVFPMMRNLIFCQKDRRPPDLYVFLDLPAEEAHARVMAAGGEKRNHFDTRNVSYYERVSDGFRKFVGQFAVPHVFVDALGTLQEVHERILAALAAKGITPG